MTDTLRNRIAAAIAYELVRQAEIRNEYWFKYTPIPPNDDDPDLPELIGLDTSIDAAQLADEVIAALGLEVEDGECGYCQAQLPCSRYSAWENDD